MAAKRLGEFLSNVTGTSGQILRVKADESGFEMFTPAGLPAYTITNDTTDRVIDADVTTIDELADVVTTLIKDLTTMVGGPVAFQWSASEQVWPFEKDRLGRTLYCKEIDFGALPSSGYKAVVHNISDLDCTKVHRHDVQGHQGSGGYYGVPGAYTYATADNTYVYITVIGNHTSVSAYFRLIYAK